MKRHELLGHLTGNGCVFVREGKKHTVYVNSGNGQSSTVPRHIEIKNTLVRKICDDLGIRDPWAKS